jgi:hypothetical protein
MRKIVRGSSGSVVDVKDIRYEPNFIYVGKKPASYTWFFLRRSGNARFYFYSFHAEGEIYPVKGSGYSHPMDTISAALIEGWDIWEIRNIRELRDLLEKA